MNEGHAAFAVLGRARSFMQETRQPFEVALAVTRAGNLFTTHTAVADGFDSFAPALIEQYLGSHAKQQLGISLHDLLALGRRNQSDIAEPFNMAYLAVRGSGAVNGVSRLHGEVSRDLFASLFPHWPVNDVPVGYVTNGVHMPSWGSAAADDLWTKACGKDQWLGTTETLERDIRCATDAGLWNFRIAAGKAHPADQAGQALIHKWITFIRRPEVRPHVIFLSDYDMHLTKQLVQGVDVWINTPRRLWEACGTSGIKVLINGGINLSELDGWWAEAYTPEVGWALGDGQEHGDDPAWDAAETVTLYELLEREVIPEFYTRNDQGIPNTWVNRMRESMARLTPQFSANPTLREYSERYYLPAAAAYRERAAEQGSIGVQVVNWQQELRNKWANLRLGDVKTTTSNKWHHFEVQVYLNGIGPDEVLVELYAEASNGGSPFRQKLCRDHPLVGAEHGYTYKGQVLATSPSGDFTARTIPYLPGVTIPLEEGHILWKR